MKIKVQCMECLYVREVDDLKNASMPDFFELASLQINEENVYRFNCKKGHQNIAIHIGEKFELLFESAILAMADGYLKEAVSSMAASVERLYEYAIRILTLENTVQNTDLETVWKIVGSQSERQLGAFAFLYLSILKLIPPVLGTKQVEFRNKVIHKGYFPNYEETLNFGEKCLELIYSIVESINRTCQSGIEKYQYYKNEEITLKKEVFKTGVFTLNTETLINVGTQQHEFKGMTLKNYMTMFRQINNS